MGKSWHSNGQVMSQQWASHVTAIGNSWHSNGQVMAQQWASHGTDGLVIATSAPYVLPVIKKYQHVISGAKMIPSSFVTQFFLSYSYV